MGRGLVAMREDRESRVARVRRIARALGYDEPTPLQREAFATPGVLSGQDVFVVGATSSGKTLIPVLLYLDAVVRAVEERAPVPRLLFVVPYRALAAQKAEELRLQLNGALVALGIETTLSCEQSTGEFRAHDDAIRDGSVDVAVVITEKVYNFASADLGFLARYDYLVLDEVGLVDDGERGARLDFVIAWAAEQRARRGSPRMVALATPSFDWESYVEAYGFAQVKVDERPVPLEEHVVRYRRSTVAKKFYFDVALEGPAGCCVAEGRWFLPAYRALCAEEPEKGAAPCPALPEDAPPCPLTEPCRSDRARPCPRTGEPCAAPAMWVDARALPGEGVALSSSVCALVERVCRHHALRGQQVLVFKNNREDVRSLARLLWRALGEELIALDPERRSVARDPERARAFVLEAAGREAGCVIEPDDVYGVLEGPDGSLELYQALAAGIGFHSAAVPNELRAYVERHLLEKRDLSVVCCTETLAYGVNSAVDAVVIADITKQVSGTVCPLTLNEYQNYIGRAGRLRAGRPRAEARGWAYVLLNVKTKADREEDAVPRQVAFLQDIRRMAEHPRRLHSSIFDAENDRLPFFLLNLVPPGGAVTTWGALREAVERLPMPAERQGDAAYLAGFRTRVNDALGYLERAGLIADVPGRFGRNPVPGCALTQQGERLRGFIIGAGDYGVLREALAEAFVGPSAGFSEETLLYRLISARHVQANCGTAFLNAKRRWCARQLQAFFRKRMGAAYDTAPWLAPLRSLAPQDYGGQRLYTLAALLGWVDGAAPGWIYENFGVQYPLVQAMAEQVGYLVEVCCHALRDVVEQKQEKLEQSVRANAAVDKHSGARGGRHAHGLDALASLRLRDFDAERIIADGERQLRALHTAVLYGINRDVRARLIEGLGASADPRAQELARTYAGGIDPTIARDLRRIGIRYRFFAAPGPGPDADEQTRANHANQQWQYTRDVEAMSLPLRRFFAASFPRVFGVAPDRPTDGTAALNDQASH